MILSENPNMPIPSGNGQMSCAQITWNDDSYRFPQISRGWNHQPASTEPKYEPARTKSLGTLSIIPSCQYEIHSRRRQTFWLETQISLVGLPRKIRIKQFRNHMLIKLLLLAPKDAGLSRFAEIHSDGECVEPKNRQFPGSHR